MEGDSIGIIALAAIYVVTVQTPAAIRGKSEHKSEHKPLIFGSQAQILGRG